MKLYFRKRKQGAFAFRLDVENRQRRLEMVHIATINDDGEIIPQSIAAPTEAEFKEIESWVAEQAEHFPETEADRAIRDINLIAHWITTEAGDDEILTSSDPILLAMHDLRQVIVRRLSLVGSKQSTGTD
ncbi:MAG: hypothetical protein AAGC81_02065 [Pseudomonadota bacterium]